MKIKLQDSINHWQYLYQFGGSDPFWSDGCNLNAKIQEQTSVNNVIWYVKGLEKAILQNDLISMRRANAENYISAFEHCIKRVKDLYQHEEQQGQLSLF